MRRFALVILVTIQSCTVFVTCPSLCTAQEKVAEASAAIYLDNMKVGVTGHLAGQQLYRMTVTQVFKNRILVRFVFHDRSGVFFVKGIDTKGLVSDTRWETSPDDIFKVTGTETYETVAGGTKTVFVLSKMCGKEKQAVHKAPDPFAKLPEEVAKYARARQADEIYLLEQLRKMQDAVAETSKRIQGEPTPKGKAALSGQLQARQAIVADLLEQLREMQDANIRPLCGPIAPVWRTMQRLKMKVGDIGRFPSFQRTSVIQVFENKILVNFDWGNMASRNSPDRTGVLFVKGIDTKGIVSDAKWRPFPEDIFEVTGTETYETVAGGTKTVFVLSRVRADRIQAYVKAKLSWHGVQVEFL